MPEAVIRPAGFDPLEWLKAREPKVLLVTVVAQLVILLSMIAIRAVPLMTGQTVLVRVQPVDPRDLFRGDYVTLSYEFSRTPAEGVQGLKVRIGMRDNSTAKAEADLRNALLAAGLSQTAFRDLDVTIP